MRKKALVCLLTAVLCFSMTACGESKSEETTQTETATEETATDETATDATDSTDETADSATDDTAAASDFSMDGAAEQTWGAMTVSVPSGWEFKTGDFMDEKDERYCSVKKSDLSYFDFKMEDADVAKQQYEYNKKTYTNEQSDVSGKIGDIDWTGFQYSDGFGGYGFELTATVGDKPVRVSCAGFAFDSAEAKAILESFKVIS